jgi:ribosomal protein L21E
MRVTLNDGTVFEGTFEEYVKLYRYNVVEPHKEPERLSVGDYVKVIDERSTRLDGHGYEIGEIVKIALDDYSNMPYKGQRLDGKGGNWLYEEEVVLATPAELAEAKRKMEEENRKAGSEKWAKIGRKVGEFKVGDIVKYVGGGNGCHGFKGKYEGLITRIIWDDKTTRPYLLERPKGVQTSDGTWSYGKELELISPVESVVNLSV